MQTFSQWPMRRGHQSMNTWKHQLVSRRIQFFEGRRRMKWCSSIASVFKQSLLQGEIMGITEVCRSRSSASNLRSRRARFSRHTRGPSSSKCREGPSCRRTLLSKDIYSRMRWLFTVSLWSAINRVGPMPWIRFRTIRLTRRGRLYFQPDCQASHLRRWSKR